MSALRTISLSAALFLSTTTFAQSTAAEKLTADIRQRDSAETRATALANVKKMLAADPRSQAAALNAVRMTGDVKYDRTGLEAAIVPLLQSPDADVRAEALWALPQLKPDLAVLENVAALAKDPDPKVRQNVMGSYVFIRAPHKIDTPITEPALTLLGDKDKEVIVETARCLWGVAITPEVEAKVIELSQFPENQIPDHKSIQYWMNYLVLSTRPTISEPVARRLGEIARHPRLDGNWTGRAIWGLANGSTPDAQPVIAKALIEELDNSLDPYHREWAVRGLIPIKSDAVTKKLQEVAKSSEETEEVRELAAAAVAQR